MALDHLLGRLAQARTLSDLDHLLDHKTLSDILNSCSKTTKPGELRFDRTLKSNLLIGMLINWMNLILLTATRWDIYSFTIFCIKDGILDYFDSLIMGFLVLIHDYLVYLIH